MIPSLLQIPSAVSDSKLHSVLPNNGKGDFQFDRSTGATRINKDGLIEEVGYFSSELVQNGNFSELGSELVTNGDFATDSNWTLATGWSINNGKAHNVGVDGYLRQDMTLVNGKTYKVVFTVSNYVSGSVRVRFMGGTAVSGGFKSSNNTFTQYLTSTGNTNVRLQSDDFIGSIDNVSVKQVDPNDRWTLGTGWSFGTNKAISDSTVAFQSLTQSAAISNSNGKTFKVKFTISDYQSGGVALYISGFINNSFFIFANGDYEYDLTVSSGTSGNVEFLTHSGGFKGSVSNVSIVEVQGDKPRLSYDITNGVVEDKPHLLLEPSATNLFTFSEDFSQSVWGKSDSQILSATHKNPDGTTNAKVLAYNGGTNQHYMSLTPSVSSGQDYTFSVFLKAKELKFVCLIFLNGVAGRYFNLENGTLLGTFGATPTDSKIEDFGNGWYRCSITDSATSTTKLCGIYLSENGTSIDSITPTTTNGVYVWGAQFEQQSYATSYIPTAGTTITRAAETCNNSKPSVNSTEGVLYCEIAALTDLGSYRLISLSDGTSISNRITILYDISDNKIYGQCVVGGGTVAFIPFVPTSISDFHKIAFKYKANDFQLWVDGVKVGTDTSGSTPTGLSRLSFDRADGVDDWYGKVKGLAVYNEALSESQLMQLTGVTASSIYNNFVTRTASFTVEALNEVKKVIDNL